MKLFLLLALASWGLIALVIIALFFRAKAILDRRSTSSFPSFPSVPHPPTPVLRELPPELGRQLMLRALIKFTQTSHD